MEREYYTVSDGKRLRELTLNISVPVVDIDGLYVSTVEFMQDNNRRHLKSTGVDAIDCLINALILADIVLRTKRYCHLQFGGVGDLGLIRDIKPNVFGGD